MILPLLITLSAASGELPPAIVVLYHPENVRVVIAPRPEVCLDRMTDSFRVVENSGEREPGPVDEWGLWQLRPQNWRRYSTMIQWNAPEWEQRRVARAFVGDLAAALERAGVRVTPYTLGLAWNGGIGAAIRGSAPKRAREYAGRVAAIYGEQI